MRKKLIFIIISVIILVILLYRLSFKSSFIATDFYIENSNDTATVEIIALNCLDKYIEINWNNSSREILYFSPRYKIYFEEKGKWVELQRDENYIWLDLLPFVDSTSTRSFKYDLSGFNLRRPGKYKLELSCWQNDNSDEPYSVVIGFKLSSKILN